MIQSSVINLAITVGNWCLIPPGPFERPYDTCLRTVCPGIEGEAIIHWLPASSDQGWTHNVNSPRTSGLYTGEWSPDSEPRL